MLTYDNHVEVRLVEDKKPEPEKSDAGTFITISVTATLAITLTLSFAAELPGKPPTTAPFWKTPEQTEVDKDKENFTEEVVIPPPSVSFAPRPGEQVRINQCNGVEEYDGAYFRTDPVRKTETIRGVVPEGDLVRVVGERIDADGISWYPVVNLSRLRESDQPDVWHWLDENQTGWVAACFVD